MREQYPSDITREQFEKIREIFDKYEKAVLKARNSAAELATEEYLSELSKKSP